ncbi:MAG: alpha/beta hydrolase, partial [Streptomyces sp.]|nr:alpha/beta hydrolase [Streptomyces sp.]
MVFVHGLFSSPKTWDAFVELLDSDEELSFASALRFGYASPKFRIRPDRRIPNFNDLAGQLKAFVEHRTKGYDRLVLVAHSQGGLVVQRYLAQMLAQGRGQELARIRGVLLFACPNDGSGFALSLRTSWWQPNPQERALRPFDEQVKDAHRTVIGQVVNATVSGPSTSPIPFRVYGGTEDNVVVRASAQGAFPDVAMLPGDHFGIIQPASRKDDSYLALREHLLEVRRARAGRPNSGPSPGGRVATVTRPEVLQEDTLLGVGPAVLEVHPAALPGADAGTAQHPPLTPYLTRSHDGLLRQVLAPALAGGPSVLAMLTGESSTGKTRANYEAILELAPARPLFRPATADDLLALVADGRITAGTVLWLNESQRFLHGSAGARAAAALRGLLERQSGIAAVGTLWQDPYWDELTRQGVPEDPNGQARALLTGPHTRRITVAAELSDDDRTDWEALARQHSDGRLSHALAAGASDGRVVQHLSGGPELLAAYLDGPGHFFTHAEHAVLTAALDARRLGHKSPLPAVLLADAADGTLPARHCAAEPAWTQHALS